MAINGTFPKDLPEGSYDDLTTVWLAGQGDDDAASRKYNAANLTLAGPVGPPGEDGTDGANGTDGVNGTTPTLTIGDVNTVAPGEPANVTLTGNETFPMLNFNIPRGADGTNGTNGIDGTNGTNGTNGIDGTNGTNGTNGTDGMNGTSAMFGQINFGADWTFLGTTLTTASTIVGGMDLASLMDSPPGTLYLFRFPLGGGGLLQTTGNFIPSGGGGSVQAIQLGSWGVTEATADLMIIPAGSTGAPGSNATLPQPLATTDGPQFANMTITDPPANTDVLGTNAGGKIVQGKIKSAETLTDCNGLVAADGDTILNFPDAGAGTFTLKCIDGARQWVEDP